MVLLIVENILYISKTKKIQSISRNGIDILRETSILEHEKYSGFFNLLNNIEAKTKIGLK